MNTDIQYGLFLHLAAACIETLVAFLDDLLNDIEVNEFETNALDPQLPLKRKWFAL